MCQLRRHLKRPKKGYKIVILKNGKKFSPAMGIEYKDGEPVRIPKKQHRLTDLYSRKILDPKADNGFSMHMVGRTAVFKDLDDAEYSFHRVKYGTFDQAAIFESTVSIDVMSGVGGKGSKRKVYAGRVITFGERIY